jgi:hypothetical protein
MSNVAKSGSAAGPSPGPGPRDAGERAPKAGDFESVLRDKGQSARTGRPEPSAEGRRVEEAPATGAEGRRGRGSPSGSDGPPAERGDAGEWRALPGDVAVPVGSRLDPGALAALESSRGADAVVRVERIAEQIVKAAEMRLGPGGTAEMRLELDLGGLGQLRVALGRDAEGRVAVRFDGAGPEAARLLVDHGSELVARLEARGLVLREVALTGADGTLVRLGSPTEPAPAELASRHAGDPAGARGEPDRGSPDDQRRRRGAEPPVEDEE